MMTIIRIILTGLLIRNVYREAGKWTALSFLLIAVMSEIALVVKRSNRF